MNEFVTDDEQVERIKKWWADNGSSVIAGLVIGIGGLLGWRYWVYCLFCRAVAMVTTTMIHWCARRMAIYPYRSHR